MVVNQFRLDIKMKPFLWAIFLILIVVCSAVVIFSPWLGLGEKYDFFLYRLVGIPRTLALFLLLSPTFVLILYKILGIGAKSSVGKRGGQELKLLIDYFAHYPSKPLSRRALLFFFLAFLCILYFSFAFNSDCLLYGMDGAIWDIQGRTRFEYHQPYSQVGVEPFEGNFDGYFPFSHDYVLPSVLMRFLFGEFPDRLTTFFILAVFLFLATYWFARTVGVGRSAALLSGFLLPLLAFPGFVNLPSRFYIYFNLIPDPSQIVGLSLLIVAALWALDGKGPRVKYALLLMPSICLMIAILGFAAYLPLMVPATLLYGGASLLDARRLRDNIPRVAAMLLMIAVPAALGAWEYMYGLYQYTAYNFFSQEFEQVRNNLIFASTFWSGLYGSGAIILGIAGAAWTANAKSGRLRLFAWTHLVVTALFLVTAITVVLFVPSYKGISPVYFETCFWPYTLIFAAVAIITAVRAIIHAMINLEFTWRGLSTSRLKPRWTWIPNHCAMIALVLIIVFVTVSNVARAVQKRPSSCEDFGWSHIKPTAITDILQQNIAIKPGSNFNGIAATIDGIEGRPSVTWLDLHFYDRELWKATGNEHRMPGLWKFAIPTLIQYGSFRSPPYYLILTDFFTRPSDRQERSGLTLTRIDAPMMRLLGVRYVITDTDTDAGKVVTEIPVKGHANLRLVELADVNVGNYSPTEIERVLDFHSGLAALHDPNFDGRRKVLTDMELNEPFVPAKLESLVYEKDGFSLRAESAGVSMLVLPIQYSHCWSVEGEGSTGPVPGEFDAARCALPRQARRQTCISLRADPCRRLPYRGSPRHDTASHPRSAIRSQCEDAIDDEFV